MSTGGKVSWTLTLLGGGMVAAPFIAPEAMAPLGDGQYALAFVGAIMALSSFVCVFVFRSRDRVRRQLRAGRDLLAHWTYTEAEWGAFAGGETRRQAATRRTLLWIVAVAMLAVTGGITAFEPEVGLGVGAVMAVGWMLCWLAARAALRGYRQNELAPAVDARICADGLQVGAEFHSWRGWGARLERCALQAGPPPQFEVIYSTPSRYSRTETSVRVPIPAGKESEASALVQKLAPGP